MFASMPAQDQPKVSVPKVTAPEVSTGDMTRREFNAGVTGIAVLSAAAEAAEAQSGHDIASVPCSLIVNRQQHQLSIEPRVTLVRSSLAGAGTSA
jgi:hypothetical protein